VQEEGSRPSELSGEGGAKRRSAQAQRGRLGCLLRARGGVPQQDWFPCISVKRRDCFRYGYGFWGGPSQAGTRSLRNSFKQMVKESLAISLFELLSNLRRVPTALVLISVQLALAKQDAKEQYLFLGVGLWEAIRFCVDRILAWRTS
jgi:hypothetical protein